MRWHISSTNANPGSAGLGAQIDDNLGGCGGACAGSNQFGDVEPEPVSVTPGTFTYLFHQIMNTGNGVDATAILDGFTITGGDQQGFPANLAPTDPTIKEFAAVQGGGIFANAYARYLQITNNVMQNNGGAYAGAIRLGTPHLPDALSDAENDFVRIAHNRILANGGTNLAGAIGLFKSAMGFILIVIAYWLADKLAGNPWITRIPFPVHVVERVETHDRISGNRFVTRYAYHHGYFDGVEREFRGFGLVEQWDTEAFAALSENQAFPNT